MHCRTALQPQMASGLVSDSCCTMGRFAEKWFE
ncbi:hypothetical protein ID866_13198 [Astraeus odoratus]|nr:hypothetical protein ID866_13198 [Astraeus odoratus]